MSFSIFSAVSKPHSVRFVALAGLFAVAFLIASTPAQARIVPTVTSTPSDPIKGDDATGTADTVTLNAENLVFSRTTRCANPFGSSMPMVGVHICANDQPDDTSDTLNVNNVFGSYSAQVRLDDNGFLVATGGTLTDVTSPFYLKAAGFEKTVINVSAITDPVLNFSLSGLGDVTYETDDKNAEINFDRVKLTSLDDAGTNSGNLDFNFFLGTVDENVDLNSTGEIDATFESTDIDGNLTTGDGTNTLLFRRFGRTTGPTVGGSVTTGSLVDNITISDDATITGSLNTGGDDDRIEFYGSKDNNSAITGGIDMGADEDTLILARGNITLGEIDTGTGNDTVWLGIEDLSGTGVLSYANFAEKKANLGSRATESVPKQYQDLLIDLKIQRAALDEAEANEKIRISDAREAHGVALDDLDETYEASPSYTTDFASYSTLMGCSGVSSASAVADIRICLEAIAADRLTARGTQGTALTEAQNDVDETEDAITDLDLDDFADASYRETNITFTGSLDCDGDSTNGTQKICGDVDTADVIWIGAETTFSMPNPDYDNTLSPGDAGYQPEFIDALSITGFDEITLFGDNHNNATLTAEMDVGGTVDAPSVTIPANAFQFADSAIEDLLIIGRRGIVLAITGGTLSGSLNSTDVQAFNDSTSRDFNPEAVAADADDIAGKPIYGRDVVALINVMGGGDVNLMNGDDDLTIIGGDLGDVNLGEGGDLARIVGIETELNFIDLGPGNDLLLIGRNDGATNFRTALNFDGPLGCGSTAEKRICGGGGIDTIHVGSLLTLTLNDAARDLSDLVDIGAPPPPEMTGNVSLVVASLAEAESVFNDITDEDNATDSAFTYNLTNLTAVNVTLLEGDDQVVFDDGTYTGAISGGDGLDELTFNGGEYNTISGDAQNDDLTFNGGTYNGAVSGGAGGDDLTIVGGTYIGGITGDAGGDTFHVSGVTDIASLDPGTGGDTVTLLGTLTLGAVIDFGDDGDSLDLGYDFYGTRDSAKTVLNLVAVPTGGPCRAHFCGGSSNDFLTLGDDLTVNVTGGGNLTLKGFDFTSIYGGTHILANSDLGAVTLENSSTTLTIISSGSGLSELGSISTAAGSNNVHLRGNVTLTGLIDLSSSGGDTISLGYDFDSSTHHTTVLTLPTATPSTCSAYICGNGDMLDIGNNVMIKDTTNTVIPLSAQGFVMTNLYGGTHNFINSDLGAVTFYSGTANVNGGTTLNLSGTNDLNYIMGSADSDTVNILANTILNFVGTGLDCDSRSGIFLCGGGGANDTLSILGNVTINTGASEGNLTPLTDLDGLTAITAEWDNCTSTTTTFEVDGVIGGACDVELPPETDVNLATAAAAASGTSYTSIDDNTPITNTGELTGLIVSGTVDLEDGPNVVTFNAGTYTGAVTGGTGNDAITLIGTLLFGNSINLETGDNTLWIGATSTSNTAVATGYEFTGGASTPSCGSVTAHFCAGSGVNDVLHVGSAITYTGVTALTVKGFEFTNLYGDVPHSFANSDLGVLRLGSGTNFNLSGTSTNPSTLTSITSAGGDNQVVLTGTVTVDESIDLNDGSNIVGLGVTLGGDHTANSVINITPGARCAITGKAATHAHVCSNGNRDELRIGNDVTLGVGAFTATGFDTTTLNGGTHAFTDSDLGAVVFASGTNLTLTGINDLSYIMGSTGNDTVIINGGTLNFTGNGLRCGQSNSAALGIYLCGGGAGDSDTLTIMGNVTITVTPTGGALSTIGDLADFSEITGQWESCTSTATLFEANTVTDGACDTTVLPDVNLATARGAPAGTRYASINDTPAVHTGELTGLIVTGTVDLEDGDNTVTFNGGNYAGAVTGGTGNDTITLRGDLSFGSSINLETGTNILWFGATSTSNTAVETGYNFTAGATPECGTSVTAHFCSGSGTSDAFHVGSAITYTGALTAIGFETTTFYGGFHNFVDSSLGAVTVNGGRLELTGTTTLTHLTGATESIDIDIDGIINLNYINGSSASDSISITGTALNFLGTTAANGVDCTINGAVVTVRLCGGGGDDDVLFIANTVTITVDGAPITDLAGITGITRNWHACTAPFDARTTNNVGACVLSTPNPENHIFVRTNYLLGDDGFTKEGVTDENTDITGSTDADFVRIIHSEVRNIYLLGGAAKTGRTDRNTGATGDTLTIRDSVVYGSIYSDDAGASGATTGTATTGDEINLEGDVYLGGGISLDAEDDFIEIRSGATLTFLAKTQSEIFDNTPITCGTVSTRICGGDGNDTLIIDENVTIAGGASLSPFQPVRVQNEVVLDTLTPEIVFGFETFDTPDYALSGFTYLDLRGRNIVRSISGSDGRDTISIGTNGNDIHNLPVKVRFTSTVDCHDVDAHICGDKTRTPGDTVVDTLNLGSAVSVADVDDNGTPLIARGFEFTNIYGGLHNFHNSDLGSVTLNATSAVTFSGDNILQYINGSDGNDVITLNAGFTDNNGGSGVSCSGASVRICGDNGNDIIILNDGSSLNGMIGGGAGNDSIRISGQVSTGPIHTGSGFSEADEVVIAAGTALTFIRTLVETGAFITVPVTPGSSTTVTLPETVLRNTVSCRGILTRICAGGNGLLTVGDGATIDGATTLTPAHISGFNKFDAPSITLSGFSNLNLSGYNHRLNAVMGTAGNDYITLGGSAETTWTTFTSTLVCTGGNAQICGGDDTGGNGDTLDLGAVSDYRNGPLAARGFERTIIRGGRHELANSDLGEVILEAGNSRTGENSLGVFDGSLVYGGATVIFSGANELQYIMGSNRDDTVIIRAGATMHFSGVGVNCSGVFVRFCGGGGDDSLVIAERVNITVDGTSITDLANIGRQLENCISTSSAFSLALGVDGNGACVLLAGDEALSDVVDGNTYANITGTEDSDTAILNNITADNVYLLGGEDELYVTGNSNLGSINTGDAGFSRVTCQDDDPITVPGTGETDDKPTQIFDRGTSCYNTNRDAGPDEVFIGIRPTVINSVPNTDGGDDLFKLVTVPGALDVATVLNFNLVDGEPVAQPHDCDSNMPGIQNICFGDATGQVARLHLGRTITGNATSNGISFGNAQAVLYGGTVRLHNIYNVPAVSFATNASHKVALTGLVDITGSIGAARSSGHSIPLPTGGSARNNGYGDDVLGFGVSAEHLNNNALTAAAHTAIPTHVTSYASSQNPQASQAACVQSATRNYLICGGGGVDRLIIGSNVNFYKDGINPFDDLELLYENVAVTGKAVAVRGFGTLELHGASKTNNLHGSLHKFIDSDLQVVNLISPAAGRDDGIADLTFVLLGRSTITSIKGGAGNDVIRLGVDENGDSAPTSITFSNVGLSDCDDGTLGVQRICGGLGTDTLIISGSAMFKRKNLLFFRPDVRVSLTTGDYALTAITSGFENCGGTAQATGDCTKDAAETDDTAITGTAGRDIFHISGETSSGLNAREGHDVIYVTGALVGADDNSNTIGHINGSLGNDIIHIGVGNLGGTEATTLTHTIPGDPDTVLPVCSEGAGTARICGNHGTDRLVVSGEASIYGTTNFNPLTSNLVSGFELIELRKFAPAATTNLDMGNLQELALISGRDTSAANKQDINLGDGGAITAPVGDAAHRVKLVGVNLSSVATQGGPDKILLAGDIDLNKAVTGANLAGDTVNAVDAGAGDDVVILGALTYGEIYNEESLPTINDVFDGDYTATVEGAVGAARIGTTIDMGAFSLIEGGAGTDVLVLKNRPRISRDGRNVSALNELPATGFETLIIDNTNVAGFTMGASGVLATVTKVSLNNVTVSGGITDNAGTDGFYLSGNVKLDSLELTDGDNYVYLGVKLDSDGTSTQDRDTVITFTGLACNSDGDRICAGSGTDTLEIGTRSLRMYVPDDGGTTDNDAYPDPVTTTVAIDGDIHTTQREIPGLGGEFSPNPDGPDGNLGLSRGYAAGFENLVFEFDLQLENALIPAMQSLTRDLALSAMQRDGTYSGERKVEGQQLATMKSFLAPDLTAKAGYEQDIKVAEHGTRNALWQSESGAQSLKAGGAMHLLSGELSAGEEVYEITGQASGIYLAYEAYDLDMQFYVLGAWFDIVDTNGGSVSHREAIAEGTQMLVGGRVAYEVEMGSITLTPNASAFWQDSNMDENYVYIGREETTGLVAVDAAWATGSLKAGLAYDGDYSGYDGGTQHYYAEPAVVMGLSQALPSAGDMKLRLEAGWRRGLDTNRETGNLRLTGTLAF